MSKEGGAASGKVNLAIAQAYKKRSDRNKSTIREKCEKSVELQDVVLAAIDDFEEAQANALKDGKSVSEVVLASRKRRRTDAPSAAAAEGEFDDDDQRTAQAVEDIELRRGQLRYSTWTDKLCKSALNFVHPAVMDWQTLKQMDRDTRRQCLEFGMDLKVFSEKGDVVGHKMQRQLFTSLRLVYRRLGERFGKITIAAGRIDWVRDGFFVVGARTEVGLQITCRLYGWSAMVPAAVLCEDEGPFAIKETGSR